jgi:hypothetical protein
MEGVPPGITLQPGVVGYLLKPFQREKVLAVVREGVNWHLAAARRSGADKATATLDDWVSGGTRPTRTPSKVDR